MALARRDLLKELLAVGMLPGFAPLSKAATRAFGQTQSSAALGFELDQEAFGFWTDFLRSTSVPGSVNRGVPTGLEREAFFFHYGSQGFRGAMDIPPTELLAAGDVSVSTNVVAFKPADEDRNTFERLANAQLRLDFVQSVPILDVLDTMAWTAVAALHPDRTNKLPPIQNLSFDPGATWQKMQNILLPGGQGQWAVNLYAQKKNSSFLQVLSILTKEVPRFAPVIGLPGISTVALQSFNNLYGALHSGPQYLFKTNPVPVFATQAALKASPASRGLQLRTGTYVLVPLVHAAQLTQDRLQGLELKQGLIVPKNTASPDLYSAAVPGPFPGVTYATIDVVVKPAQLPTSSGQRGGPPAPGGQNGRGGR